MKRPAAPFLDLFRAFALSLLISATVTMAAKPVKNSVYYGADGGCPPPRPEFYAPPLLTVEDHKDFEQAFIREPVLIRSTGMATIRSTDRIIKKFGAAYSQSLALTQFKSQCFSTLKSPGFTFFELPLIYAYKHSGDPEITPPQVLHFLPYYLLDDAEALTALSSFAADLQIDAKGRVKKVTPLRQWRTDKKIINQIFDTIKESHGDYPLFGPSTKNGKPIPSSVRLHWGVPEEDADEMKRLADKATTVRQTKDFSALSLKIPESIDFEASNSMSAMIWSDGLGRVQGGYFMLGNEAPEALHQFLFEKLLEVNLLGYTPSLVSLFEYDFDPSTRLLSIADISYSDVVQAVPLRTPNFRLPYVKVKGVFKMILTISEEGSVSHIEFLETPHKVLNKFVIKGMKDWLFAPATAEGRPIESYMNLELPVDKAGPDLDALDRALRYR